MAKKKRLGRGLEALLSKPGTATANKAVPAASSQPAVAAEGLQELAVDLLQRGQYQPRSDMRKDSLEDLASSIKAQGIVQPIVVRQINKGASKPRYEIIAGERRWRAAQMAGLQDVPVVIRDIDDDAAIAMSLIENIQREDLNPLEEALALDRLLREFDLTHQQAADAVGRSRAAVSNLLRLLDLSPKVKPLLEERKLDMGHARALLAIEDPVAQQKAAQQVVAKGMSVRETEKLIRQMLGKDKAKGSSAKAEKSTDIRRLEQEVGDKLGARVSIEHAAKGNGQLVIRYNSLDELDGILQHIK